MFQVGLVRACGEATRPGESRARDVGPVLVQWAAEGGPGTEWTHRPGWGAATPDPPENTLAGPGTKHRTPALPKCSPGLHAVREQETRTRL